MRVASAKVCAAAAAAALLSACSVTAAVPPAQLDSRVGEASAQYPPDGDGWAQLGDSPPPDGARPDSTPGDATSHKRQLNRRVGGDPFRGPPNQTAGSRGKVIHLTFDDGPWGDNTSDLLDVLASRGARATFFVVGDMVRVHPELVQRMTAEGHAVGNHTRNHADLRRLSDDDIRRQLLDTEESVDAAGGRIAGCMRPPYGSRDDRVVRVARDMGYRTVMWTADPGDWYAPSRDELMKRMKAATRPGVNLLLHDGGGDRTETVAAVAQMLIHWQQKGYRFEPLPQCLG